MTELNLLLVIAAGFGFLLVRHRYRMASHRRLAARRDLEYAPRGLADLPAQLQATVLFAIADGGHEHDVVSGNLNIGEDSVPFSSFEFAFQRDVRGEWAYLTTDPPFRLSSPVTVLAYQLPREFAHHLVKRRGISEKLADGDGEIYKSVASVAREASGIERAVAVPPPATLVNAGGPKHSATISRDYLIWAESPEQAASVLPAPTIAFLESEAAGDKELVVELLGPLLLIYCASAAALSEADSMAMSSFADELCRRILASTAPYGPRGVGY